MSRKPQIYQDNIELTSLLIRIKNSRNNVTNPNYLKINKRVTDLIRTRIRLIYIDYEDVTKRERKNKLINRLKSKIIELSETCPIDEKSYNRFGEVILLIIKRILTSPQFFGYTYKDEFYSDAVYKILKYLGNFDHNKISEKTGQKVNAFSYITQIIRMSILFVINTKNDERRNAQNHLKLSLNDDFIKHNILINDKEKEVEAAKYTREMNISHDEVKNLGAIISKALEKPNLELLTIHLPEDALLNFNQYNELELYKQTGRLEIGCRYKIQQDSEQRSEVHLCSAFG